MTRARARALEIEVTSLLSDFHFDAHETWLLPHMDTLCILRYHGEDKEQGEEEEEGGHEDGEEEEMQEKLQALATGLDRTSDELQAPDVRPSPDDRHPRTRAKSMDFRSPPDDR
ncbi:hypothetical protein VPH35_104644 [Triticum aestivum]